MKKSALFFDIDGTIISEHTKGIPESAIKALHMARKNGHHIFVNTGRTVCSVPGMVKQIGFDGFLCGCGCYIVYRDKVLMEHAIPEERGYLYIDKMKEYQIEGFLEGTEDNYFSERISRCEEIESVKRYMASLGLGVEKTMEKKDFRYDKILIRVDDKCEKEKFFEVIAEDLIPIDRTGGVYECIQKQYSKATAIEYMRRYLNLEMDQIYVFGDSSNDLAMFEYADHAVAMGEHDPVLEPYAEYITDTVENDGLYKAMEHYGLI